MPRKVLKADKPALLFLERPVCVARLRNVPEVRAAINPKDFFTETQNHSSTLNSWVNPQFDSSAASALPVRRGRRKCQSATSVLDKCSQLSRKNSVRKFPPLSFQTGTRDKPQKPKSTSVRTGAESAALSKARNQPQGPCQSKRLASSGHSSDTSKRLSASTRKNGKRNAETDPEGDASHLYCSDHPGIHFTEVTNRSRIPAEGASTPPSSELSTTEVSIVSPQPDVDTPNTKQGGSSLFSFPACLLLTEPCTPPCEPPDVLVVDTPERDYGLKVTWRRRKCMMMMLKERGHLSDSDTLIYSS